MLCSTAGTAIRSAAGVLCIVRVGAWYMHHPLSLNSGTVSGPEGLYTCYRRCVHCSCFASVSVSVGRGEVLVNRLVPLVRSARSGSPGHTPCPAYVPGSLLQSFRLCHCFSTPFAGGSRKTLRCQLECHQETLAELVLRSSHRPFSVVCQYSNPSNLYVLSQNDFRAKCLFLFQVFEVFGTNSTEQGRGCETTKQNRIRHLCRWTPRAPLDPRRRRRAFRAAG